MEYLFRGKKKSNGEWVYGSLLTWGDGDMSILVPDGKEAENIYHVEPETVGMYTGIRDCSGKMIFDGDILLVRSGLREETCVVVWCEVEVCWALQYSPNDWPICFYEDFPELMTIIGNRYDNAEKQEVAHEHQKEPH